MKRILRALPIVAFILPAVAHAQWAVTDPMSYIYLRNIVAAVNQVNEQTAFVGNDVNKNTAHMDRDFNALDKTEQKMLQELAVQRARSQAIQQMTGSYNPTAACNGTNETQSAGLGTGNEGQVSDQAKQLSLKWGKNSTGPMADIKGIESLPTTVFGMDKVLGYHSTLKPQDVQQAEYYNTLMLDPYPPTAPSQMPAMLANSPQAKLYNDNYSLYMQAVHLDTNIVNRSVVLRAPTVKVTKAMLDTWANIDGNTVNGQPNPGQEETGQLQAVSKNGGQYTSELNYLRTKVWRRYADPEWRGPELSQMDRNQLLRQIVLELAVTNRMQYEDFVNLGVIAYQEAERNDKRAVSDYGTKLRQIEQDASTTGN